MTVLQLSTGGGGGNILRSLKALFRRDLAVAQSADPSTPSACGGLSRRGFSTPTSFRSRQCRRKSA